MDFLCPVATEQKRSEKLAFEREKKTDIRHHVARPGSDAPSVRRPRKTPKTLSGNIVQYLDNDNG